MSLRIIVRRGAGAHPGPDIVEPLLATAPAAIERGRAEIDDAALAARVTLTLPFRHMLPGALVEVVDAAQGATWRGQVAAVRHRQAGPETITTLEVRRG